MTSDSLQEHGFLPIATATICRDTVLDFDLYVQYSGRKMAELYRSATYPIEAKDIEQLKRDGVERLYIQYENAEHYRQYLSTQVLANRYAAPTARLEAVREATRAAFIDALAASDHDRLVAVATKLGGYTAQIISNQTIPFQELFATLEHDFYTFTHVCNVSAYCVVLARQMEITDENELSQIATGALLHDIGKRHIPAKVLNKPGKLTDEEWELIREHPLSGFKELMGRTDLSWGQLMMVYQHHERMDGSGYPVGIRDDEIHPWARICAVADVFDALTCHRPYRKAVPKPEVCEHLSKHAGSAFDSEIATRWIKHVRTTS